MATNPLGKTNPFGSVTGKPGPPVVAAIPARGGRGPGLPFTPGVQHPLTQTDINPESTVGEPFYFPPGTGPEITSPQKPYKLGGG